MSEINGPLYGTKSGLPTPPPEPAIRLVKERACTPGLEPAELPLNYPYLALSAGLQHPSFPQQSAVLAQELKENAAIETAPTRIRTLAIRFIRLEVLAFLFPGGNRKPNSSDRLQSGELPSLESAPIRLLERNHKLLMISV